MGLSGAGGGLIIAQLDHCPICRNILRPWLQWSVIDTTFLVADVGFKLAAPLRASPNKQTQQIDGYFQRVGC